MPVALAIVGLGNPGTEYAGTRHNVGFEVIDALVRRHRASTPRQAHRSLVWTAQIGGTSVLLAKPLTYMNRSGEAVRGIVEAHRLSPEAIWVLVDDFHLPLGTLRIRRKGSDGGHNGLHSIITALGGGGFPRFRLGIGPPPEGVEVIDYVLGRFAAEELPIVERLVEVAADAVFVAIREGLGAAMNRFNGPVLRDDEAADPPAARKI